MLGCIPSSILDSFETYELIPSNFDVEGAVSFNNGIMTIGENSKATSKKIFTTEDVMAEIKCTWQVWDRPGASCGNRCPSPAICTNGITVGSNNIAGTRVYTMSNTEVMTLREFNDLTNLETVVGSPLVFTGGTQTLDTSLTSSTLEIKNIKFKPFFSCDINSTEEVEVRQTFSPGSEVSTKELQHWNDKFSKFCRGTLGAIQCEIDGGCREEKGEIMTKLATGKSFIVPENQMIIN